MLCHAWPDNTNEKSIMYSVTERILVVNYYSMRANQPQTSTLRTWVAEISNTFEEKFNGLYGRVLREVINVSMPGSMGDSCDSIKSSTSSEMPRYISDVTNSATQLCCYFLLESAKSTSTVQKHEIEINVVSFDWNHNPCVVGVDSLANPILSPWSR